MDTEEMFYSGFCKALNETRTVLCEFETGQDGHPRLVGTDCVYGNCPHSRTCRLMEPVRKAQEQQG